MVGAHAPVSLAAIATWLLLAPAPAVAGRPADRSIPSAVRPLLRGTPPAGSSAGRDARRRFRVLRRAEAGLRGGLLRAAGEVRRSVARPRVRLDEVWVRSARLAPPVRRIAVGLRQIEDAGVTRWRSVGGVLGFGGRWREVGGQRGPRVHVALLPLADGWLALDSRGAFVHLRRRVDLDAWPVVDEFYAWPLRPADLVGVSDAAITASVRAVNRLVAGRGGSPDQAIATVRARSFLHAPRSEWSGPRVAPRATDVAPWQRPAPAAATSDDARATR